MELKIAIVEDEANIRGEVRKMLLRWEQREIRQYDIMTRDFTTGGEFLQSGEKFDIVFLDIELEQKDSGLKVAQVLNERKDPVAIVFLTSHKENVFYGYAVKALNFLVKPVRESEIVWCLNEVVDRMGEDCFIHNGREAFKIRYNDILYLRANGHYINIETLDRGYEIIGSLKQIVADLPNEFIQCHRAYIVNIHHVVSIRKNQMVLSNNKCIEIGDKYKNDVFQLYVKKMPI